ncbi:MAG: hypothetical protein JNK82_08955 [Myxococcaceae bacterium]|nr:hypothetical protein [Myxococcaceae bacterium]
MPALASDPPPPPPPPPPSSDAPAATDNPPPPPGDSTPVEAKPRTNWARPAAYIGWGVGLGVLTLGIVSTAIGSGFIDNGFGIEFYGAGSGLMVLAALLTGAAGPVVYVGGNSARWTKSITGIRGLRIGGWIGYGVGLGMQLISVLGGWPVTTFLGGLVGAGALACFGLDAWFSANEADDVAAMADAPDPTTPRVMPTVAVLPSLNGRGGTTAMIGFSGTF